MGTIMPNDANILYSPYNWLVGAGSAKTICAGAYLKLAFTGTPTTLTATFDVTNQPTAKSRVGFRVDGGSWQDFAVASSINLALPGSVNTWGSHTVEMVMIAHTEVSNRWLAPQNTAVIFTGLTADVTVTTRTQRARKLYGMCFGDSITEGVRTLNMVTADPTRNDSRLAWAYPLADLLGAEIGVVGFGAVKFGGNGSGNVPAFHIEAQSLWDGQARDLTAPKLPDFIIAHVGTNDSSTADATVTANTTTLLNGWIAATPATTKIYIMAGWLQRKSAAITSGVAACNAPSRVVIVDTTGWWSTSDSSDALHPYGYINTTDLAPRLASLITAISGGAAITPISGSTYVNIGGVAVLT